MTTEKLQYAVSLNGKYSKQVLTKLEELFKVEKLDVSVRKIVLDGFNDLAREQTKLLINPALD